ncbi:hypothetical protein SAMN05192558_110222 [Actinokineospora alba]|uniref:Tryptophan-associated transmembrane protein (Trp_oprn_chp) n=1 Tax=Actinokineospora alba TaxID=504798 RepID=A0A1H0TVC6_9PSEU|nr:hypothetical protein [Actinokineospora alba]TDP70741.1 hypothetical protein C8E96_6370 [Actinokineospora alba]SDJ15032.1 hypothetical protein SAMN05421871_110222 [Actinokineospora alba]SDP58007.1 hypothetical protein SAMN05192558_110222 [Actinokineospora alba]
MTAGWRATALLGGLLGLAAAVSTVVGTFLPLFGGEVRAAGQVLTMTITGWDFSTTGGPKSGDAPVTGVPLSIAAGALLVAAVASLVAAPRRATPAAKRLAAALCGVATAFLAGAVATVTAQVVSWEASFRPTNNSPVGALIEYSAGVGIGFWLLVAAVVVAFPTAFLALRGGPPAVPTPAPPREAHGSVQLRSPEA